MPSRVVRSEIVTSRSLSRVSMAADLTFHHLLLIVDDYGRCDGRISLLRAALYPTRAEVTDPLIVEWLAELEREGCVRRYEVDGEAYLCLPNWEKHRANGKRAGKSRFPEPAEIPRKSPRKSADPRKSPPSERIARDEGRGTRGSEKITSSEDVGGSGGESAAALRFAASPPQELFSDPEPERLPPRPLRPASPTPTPAPASCAADDPSVPARDDPGPERPPKRKRTPRPQEPFPPPPDAPLWRDLANACPVPGFGRCRPAVVMAWFAAIRPAYEARGYRDHRRALASWWSRVRLDELRQASIRAGPPPECLRPMREVSGPLTFAESC